MATLADIVIDCNHPAALARFWQEALDRYRIADYDETELARLRALGITDVDDDPSVLLEPLHDGPGIWFQQVPEPRSEKNRVHLDLHCDDVAEEARRLSAIGASPANHQPRRDLMVMHDPEGNEFCLIT